MEKKHRYGFRKHKAVKGLGVALLGTVGVLAGSSLISANETSISEAVQTNRTVDATISRVDYNDLTAEQKARIKSGKIDEQVSWINPDTGNFEWITGFVAVYKHSGSCQVVPVDPEPEQPLIPTSPSLVPNLPSPNTPTPSPQIPSVPITPQVEPQIPSVPNTPQVEPQIPSVPNTPQVEPQVPSVPNTPQVEPQVPSVPITPQVEPQVPSVPITPQVETQVPVPPKVTVTPKPQTPSTVAQTVSKITGIPAKSVQSILPKTGSVGSKTIAIAGLGLLTLGGYLLFKNRKTGKHVAIALLVAGGVGVSSPVLANSTTFLDLVENVTLQLNSRFTYKPATDTCWEYVGYYPEIASVPAETPTSPNTLTSADLKAESQENKGKVTVYYVDENGNTIADSKELVNSVVSTTYRTKVTINGVEKVIENTVPTEVDYDTTALKVDIILFNDETYEFVTVQGSETGKVVAGETEVTYVYRKVTQPVVTREELDPIQEIGKVTVHYVDEAGNKLADSKELVNAVLSTTFRTKVTTDGVEEIVENKVVSDATYNAVAVKAAVLEFNGETYEFVSVEGNETGKVVAGETNVTYVYRKVAQPVVTREELDPIQETGKVTVHYVDEAGNKLADSKELVNAIISTTFRTKVTTDGVEEIKENTVASDATYNAASVKATSLEYNGETYEYVAVQGTETGKVVAGETVVTYVYRKVSQPVVTRKELEPLLETGTVNVHFSDEEGKVLAPSKVLVNTIVSFTERTETITDGISNIEETKRETNASYDASNLRPDRIEFEGALYEYTSVNGAVSGKVLPGENHVTYIYRKVPNTTVVTTREIKGKVITRYIDEVTGQEILPETIVKEGVIALEKTTVTKDALGNTVDTQISSTPASFDYSTEADKIVKEVEIAKKRTVATHWINPDPENMQTGLVENNAAQGLLDSVTSRVRIYSPSNPGDPDNIAETLDHVRKEGFDESSQNIEEIGRGNNTTIYGTRDYTDYRYSYTRPSRAIVPEAEYEFSRVVGEEVGSSNQEVQTITYYYRPKVVEVKPIIQKIEPEVLPVESVKPANTVEESKREITGKVITRYVDESTGQEILTGSTVAEGVVAIETTTTTKDYKGNVIDTQVTTESTNLQYDTTADKVLNNARIATMRVAPLEALNTLTGLTSPIENGKATVAAETLDVYIPLTGSQLDGKFLSDRYASERGFDSSTAQLVESEAVTMDLSSTAQKALLIPNIVTQEGVVTPELEIANGQVYYVQHYVYTKPVDLEENPVPYEFTRVDTAETGTVAEGVTVVTYYYKRVSLSVAPRSNSINIYFSHTTVKA
ncbi:MucBP domain-containing protein [Streptococcus iners]|uniref:MucBP domain-containing protein n=1 Tax=Streptococcus iners TaxID=3028084 RepID=A0AA96VIM7_9STRE|nr:MucBP domain-containing protein [Streptococcus sp. 29887]MCK4026644.1 LPXTG cell wall anchor domain-containing protein [Streptococcus suis]WNY50096.1 MucBP domain-containing protein [Streptococcus sp. 29887]